ncbi:unnamed protein product [Rangifer tarandus platyrhynchus]|uniref:Uncharacterized protein n=2 Tax=Rangifer tarandus platyrhynchus TaxID=3082113 RepID=A0ABN8YYJ1_RANTA|nr:unnamed protein product [Rangifer tarandus platyrhynchus]CAI9703073.1 unnamed protein product [Rangifer tarandus platyrhynchus]
MGSLRRRPLQALPPRKPLLASALPCDLGSSRGPCCLEETAAAHRRGEARLPAPGGNCRSGSGHGLRGTDLRSSGDQLGGLEQAMQVHSALRQSC